ILTMLLPCFSASAASGPSITTTLTDNTVQKGSKKTFEVRARNSAGKKIKATVTFNGATLSPIWDDDEKSSYILNFTKEGKNIVIISASSDGGRKKQLTYNITYEKAKNGESIGKATWSVEVFTIGCGYLIYPTEMDIYEGETSAEQLIHLLHENGLIGYYGGTLKQSFYLGYIADGTSSAQKYNGYQKSGTAKNPKKMNLNVSIPPNLVSQLNKTMTFFDPNDYEKNWNGYLGEFVITNGSGWMYTVNNSFPNVSFADTYLSDGDVVRVQFTLGYGADIGGFSAMGSKIPDVGNQPNSGYYQTANKDALTKAISRTRSSAYSSRSNVKQAYQNAIIAAKTLDASQSTVDSAVKSLNSALNNPSDDRVITTTKAVTTTKKAVPHTTAPAKITSQTKAVTTTRKTQSTKTSASTSMVDAVTEKTNKNVTVTTSIYQYTTSVKTEKSSSAVSQPQSASSVIQQTISDEAKTSIKTIESAQSDETETTVAVSETDTQSTALEQIALTDEVAPLYTSTDEISPVIAESAVQPSDNHNGTVLIAAFVFIALTCATGCIYMKNKNQHKEQNDE
ncbi:MAG: DUF4430 domain-containing protein, partial [Faecalibacterium sp.]|nr:DUF4430 domain-containing protein [Faecalibacterium sp.]